MRMLGQGRPFIMEFVNPKLSTSGAAAVNDETLRGLMKTDLVFCHDFKIVDRQFFDSLKEIETSKAKSYSCIVWVQRKISPADCEKLSQQVRELAVQQTTPVRVLHRRSLAVRDKVIHRLRATFIN